MALRARFRPMALTLTVAPGSALSPAEQAKAFAAFVRQDIARVDADNASAAGAPIPHFTYVDGRASDDLDSVRPDGVILAIWDMQVEIVGEVLAMIQKAAPVRSGRFRDSQVIYADGIAIDTPQQALGADEVVIASTLPYARKIEGLGGRKPLSPQAPKGVYQGVATLANARYGNIARIKFGTRQITGGDTALTRWAAVHSARLSHPRRRARQRARDERQPCVVMTFKV